MKKRMLISLLVLCMVLSVLCPAVYATETEAPAESTEATEVVRAPDECGEGIKWRFEDGVLTITGDGKMDDFSDGTPWANHKDKIEEVVLKGDITYIGAYAFKDFDGILSVEFGDALYEIGPEAFASCDGLSAIWLPASFKIFGEGSFQYCENLEEIHCEGKFPSFRQNCMLGTYCNIYYPAQRPWGTEYILQLEEAFKGRIQFIASDGTDPVTEPETEPATEPPTEAPTEAPTEPPTEAPTQAPTEAPTEVPTQAPTEPEVTEPAPAETLPVPQEQNPPGSWIGLIIIALVLTLIVLGALIFGGRRKKGKYSARRRR